MLIHNYCMMYFLIRLDKYLCGPLNLFFQFIHLKCITELSNLEISIFERSALEFVERKTNRGKTNVIFMSTGLCSI